MRVGNDGDMVLRHDSGSGGSYTNVMTWSGDDSIVKSLADLTLDTTTPTIKLVPNSGSNFQISTGGTVIKIEDAATPTTLFQANTSGTTIKTGLTVEGTVSVDETLTTASGLVTENGHIKLEKTSYNDFDLRRAATGELRVDYNDLNVFAFDETENKSWRPLYIRSHATYDTELRFEDSSTGADFIFLKPHAGSELTLSSDSTDVFIWDASGAYAPEGMAAGGDETETDRLLQWHRYDGNETNVDTHTINLGTTNKVVGATAFVHTASTGEFTAATNLKVDRNGTQDKVIFDSAGNPATSYYYVVVWFQP